MINDLSFESFKKIFVLDRLFVKYYLANRMGLFCDYHYTVFPYIIWKSTQHKNDAIMHDLHIYGFYSFIQFFLINNV